MAKDDDEKSDPRAKYRQLPPVIKPGDTVESVDASSIAADVDDNEGARPYLRIVMGPRIR